jgi:hypothetical protein
MGRELKSGRLHKRRWVFRFWKSSSTRPSSVRSCALPSSIGVSRRSIILPWEGEGLLLDDWNLPGKPETTGFLPLALRTDESTIGSCREPTIPCR